MRHGIQLNFLWKIELVPAVSNRYTALESPAHQVYIGMCVLIFNDTAGLYFRESKHLLVSVFIDLFFIYQLFLYFADNYSAGGIEVICLRLQVFDRFIIFKSPIPDLNIAFAFSFIRQYFYAYMMFEVNLWNTEDVAVQFANIE